MRHLRKWKACCVRDNLEPNSKEASRLLSSAKSDSGYIGNLVSWKYLAKSFFVRKVEHSRKYDINDLDKYIKIPNKYN